MFQGHRVFSVRQGMASPGRVSFFSFGFPFRQETLRCCIFALQAGRNVFCRAVFSFLHNEFMMKEASKFFFMLFALSRPREGIRGFPVYD